jgi:cell division septation protein DedD
MATTPDAPEKMTLDRSDGSATIDLYRAALGPLRADYYLKAFTRFDAAGQSGPSWNWAAALLSLNWMLFRRLWTVALAYVGAVTAATLLVFGIGRLVFQLSQEAQWMLLFSGVVLAIALPGAYGNAWLYAACNRNMERALASSATLEDACALLTRQAGAVKRLVSLAGLNLALCLIVAAVALSWPAPGALPLHTGPVAQAHVAGLVQSGLASQIQNPAATGPNLAASAPINPASSAASAPQAAASQSAPMPLPVASAATPGQGMAQRSNQGMVQEAAAAATALALPSPGAATHKPEPVSVPVPAVQVKQASEKEAVKSVPAHKAEKSLSADKPAKLTKSERLAKAKAAKVAAKAAARDAAKQALKSKTANATNATAVAGSPSESGKYLINVGLFADANNARNAYVKLQDAGLPALSQDVKSSKGPRTRVRVGPFETDTEAERAAERIRALQLDAAVFKQ